MFFFVGVVIGGVMVVNMITKLVPAVIMGPVNEALGTCFGYVLLLLGLAACVIGLWVSG
jgi:hypothetical protein